jgi:hypothetical protein
MIMRHYVYFISPFKYTILSYSDACHIWNEYYRHMVMVQVVSYPQHMENRG